jgi:hypothetical protein
MLKVFLLLKRKPGLTMEEFIDHYENVHAPLGLKHVKNIKHYERHYLRPGPYPLGGEVGEPEYDVITELWYDDIDSFNEKNELMQLNLEGLAAINADEETFLDRTKNRLVFVEDHESTIPAGGSGPR